MRGHQNVFIVLESLDKIFVFFTICVVQLGGVNSLLHSQEFLVLLLDGVVCTHNLLVGFADEVILLLCEDADLTFKSKHFFRQIGIA